MRNLPEAIINRLAQNIQTPGQNSDPRILCLITKAMTNLTIESITGYPGRLGPADIYAGDGVLVAGLVVNEKAVILRLVKDDWAYWFEIAPSGYEVRDISLTMFNGDIWVLTAQKGTAGYRYVIQCGPEGEPEVLAEKVG